MINAAQEYERSAQWNRDNKDKYETQKEKMQKEGDAYAKAAADTRKHLTDRLTKYAMARGELRQYFTQEMLKKGFSEEMAVVEKLDKIDQGLSEKEALVAKGIEDLYKGKGNRDAIIENFTALQTARAEADGVPNAKEWVAEKTEAFKKLLADDEATIKKGGRASGAMEYLQKEHPTSKAEAYFAQNKKFMEHGPGYFSSNAGTGMVISTSRQEYMAKTAELFPLKMQEQAVAEKKLNDATLESLRKDSAQVAAQNETLKTLTAQLQDSAKQEVPNEAFEILRREPQLLYKYPKGRPMSEMLTDALEREKAALEALKKGGNANADPEETKARIAIKEASIVNLQVGIERNEQALLVENAQTYDQASTAYRRQTGAIFDTANALGKKSGPIDEASIQQINELKKETEIRALELAGLQDAPVPDAVAIAKADTALMQSHRKLAVKTLDSVEKARNQQADIDRKAITALSEKSNKRYVYGLVDAGQLKKEEAPEMLKSWDKNRELPGRIGYLPSRENQTSSYSLIDIGRDPLNVAAKQDLLKSQLGAADEYNQKLEGGFTIVANANDAFAKELEAENTTVGKYDTWLAEHGVPIVESEATDEAGQRFRKIQEEMAALEVPDADAPLSERIRYEDVRLEMMKAKHEYNMLMAQDAQMEFRGYYPVSRAPQVQDETMVIQTDRPLFIPGDERQPDAQGKYSYTHAELVQVMKAQKEGVAHWSNIDFNNEPFSKEERKQLNAISKEYNAALDAFAKDEDQQKLMEATRHYVLATEDIRDARHHRQRTAETRDDAVNLAGVFQNSDELKALKAQLAQAETPAEKSHILSQALQAPESEALSGENLRYMIDSTKAYGAMHPDLKPAYEQFIANLGGDDVVQQAIARKEVVAEYLKAAADRQDALCTDYDAREAALKALKEKTIPKLSNEALVNATKEMKAEVEKLAPAAKEIQQLSNALGQYADTLVENGLLKPGQRTGFMERSMNNLLKDSNGDPQKIAAKVTGVQEKNKAAKERLGALKKAREEVTAQPSAPVADGVDPAKTLNDKWNAALEAVAQDAAVVMGEKLAVASVDKTTTGQFTPVAVSDGKIIDKGASVA